MLCISAHLSQSFFFGNISILGRNANQCIRLSPLLSSNESGEDIVVSHNIFDV